MILTSALSSAAAYRFEVSNPAYALLQNSIWVGNGRFVIHDDGGKITVESRICRVVPSTDAA